MRGLNAIDLPPWSLPLIVIALVLPITAAAVLLGPAGAFAAGFLTVFTIAVIAIRARYDEEIEVAPSPDRRHRALIICLHPIERTAEGQLVADELERRSEGFEGSSDSLVLVLARSRRLAEWLSDVDDARTSARHALDLTLAHLGNAGVQASGQVGESDMVQAVEDVLRTFPARDVIVFGDESGDKEDLRELHRRLDRPIHGLRPTAI